MECGLWLSKCANNIYGQMKYFVIANDIDPNPENPLIKKILVQTKGQMSESGWPGFKDEQDGVREINNMLHHEKLLQPETLVKSGSR